MIVPQYWAESRVQVRREGRQVTVRRFGWSDISPQDAQAQADTRAQEALERILSGENLRRREPKLAYNGAEGVPIREEIVSRQGETVITRNVYGALCLNTPNVLFADIDLQYDPSCRLTLFTFLAMVCGAAAMGFATESQATGNQSRVSRLDPERNRRQRIAAPNATADRWRSGASRPHTHRSVCRAPSALEPARVSDSRPGCASWPLIRPLSRATAR